MLTKKTANIIISLVNETGYKTYHYPLTHILPKHKLDASSDRRICL